VLAEALKAKRVYVEFDGNPGEDAFDRATTSGLARCCRKVRFLVESIANGWPRVTLGDRSSWRPYEGMD